MAEIDVASDKKKKKPAVDISKEGSVYEYKVTESTTASGIRYPDQDIPESEKTAQWYVNNIQYIATFYNVPFQTVLPPSSNNATGGGNVTRRNSLDLPVNRMLKNMTYYQGKQENYEYNDWATSSQGSDLTTSNANDNNYQAHWIKGQDIAELLNFMKGNILERVVNLQISAKALSEEAASEKEDYRTRLLMKLRYKDEFDKLEAQGVEFNVGPKEGLNSEEDIKEFMDKKFKQRGVDVAIAIAKDTWIKQHGMHKMVDAFVKCLIFGTAQIHQYVQNGKLYWKSIPSWQMIYDTRHDDDYNRDSQFKGFVETMTPTEIFIRFPQLNKEQREDIKLMARTKDLGGVYNKSFTNFLWWNYNAKRDEAVIAVVTGYWIGLHDMGIRKEKDKFDADRIRRVKSGEKGEYIFDDIYKGTLIGNKYLVDWGLDDNIVEDSNDKSKPIFPILSYLPNMVGGEPRALVSRISDIQDEIDALKYKVRDTIGKAKGKCYVIRGNVGNDTQLVEIWKDFGSMGLTVIPPSGENDQRERLVEAVDLTMDPNIMRIEEIVAINRNLMKEYMSVSNVSLGMQTSYMGMGERNAAIGQATYGLSSLYHGFMDFIQMNLQYAVNVQKNLLTMDGNDTEASFVVGEEGIAYLKVMKELRFEDILVILQLNDVLDENKKKDLQGLALAWAQNNIIDPPAYLKVLKQETYSGAERVLDVEVTKKKREQQEQMAAQQAHDQAMGAQQAQALQNAEITRQAGQDNRKHIEADAKKDVAIIQKTPSPESSQK